MGRGDNLARFVANCTGSACPIGQDCAVNAKAGSDDREGVGGHHRTSRSISSRVSSRLSSRRLIPAIALALVVVFAAPAAASPSPATTPPPTTPATPTAPAPPSLVGATAQAQLLQQQILANAKKADILDERYLEARSAVKRAAKKIAVTEKKIAATEASSARLRRQVGGRAALLYMRAGTQDPIGVDVANVQELGSRAKYGEAAAAEDTRVIDLLGRTEAKLAVQREDLNGQLASAQDRQRAVQTARQEVERVNAATQQLLDSTNDEIKVLATKMEQDSQAAAAEAEKAWLRRRAAQEAARRRAAAGKPGGGDVADPYAGDPNLPAPGAGAWKAVEYARAQLGKPYVYAGAGPDVFDCSGLTMMAWLQSGVLMEHGSRSQYMSFPHVSIDQLQPGDLVFFGVNGPMNHHVGIVVGPGVMIDAPHTGAFVELVSYFRSDLVPLGARP
jgi:cell wall-associated NlpC family hydrolase